MKRRGFTVVELLVVISITILLIALLLPALSRARYTTRLAVCRSRLKQTGAGVLSYTNDFNGHYPHRPGVPSGWKPNRLTSGSVDDRVALRGYIAINDLLNCPLTGRIDIDGSPQSIPTYSTYHLWFGYEYQVSGNSGMHRAGDRFTWAGQSWNLLASDRDVVHDGGTWVHGTHPDTSGVMFNEVLNPGFDSHFSGGQYTFSRWQFKGSTARGNIDMNWLHDDGSVQTTGDVEVFDGRMTPVPEFAHGNMWAITFLPTP